MEFLELYSGISPTFDASNLDGPSSVIVDLLVTDNLGESALAQATITIDNVAPLATIQSISAARVEGTRIDVTASATGDGQEDGLPILGSHCQVIIGK